MSDCSPSTGKVTWTEMLDETGTSGFAATETTVSPETSIQTGSLETHVSQSTELCEKMVTLNAESCEGVSSQETKESPFPVSLVQTVRSKKRATPISDETVKPAASLVVTPATNSSTRAASGTPGQSEPSAKRRRVELSLAGKVRLLKFHEAHPNITYTELAQRFAVGRSTISDIMKKKQLYINEFRRSKNGEMRRFNYICKFRPINDLVWQWYQKAKEEGRVVNGPILREKALEIAKELNMTDFKGSNGWLDSWFRRFSVGGKYGKKNKSPETEDDICLESQLSEFSETTSNYGENCVTSGSECKQNLTNKDGGHSKSENPTGEGCHSNKETGQLTTVTPPPSLKVKSRGRPKLVSSFSQASGPVVPQTPVVNPCSFGALTGLLGANMAYHDVLQTLTQLKRFAVVNETRYLEPIQSMITVTIENILKDKPVVIPPQWKFD